MHSKLKIWRYGLALTAASTGLLGCHAHHHGTAIAPATAPPAVLLAQTPAIPLAAQHAAAAIQAPALLRHIEMLASDAFEGRLPGTAGEDKTVAYLETQFRALGLQPGNPDGSYVQNVPLVGIDGSPSLRFSAAGKTITLKPREDFVAASPRFLPSVSVKDSPLVFVGYGVQAPEYQWDDFKGIDVRGKTLVMLINDPPVPLADQANSLDPQIFAGKGMTYYGRWTYKFEIASKLGAAAAIIVHETAPAAYPWAVVQNSWSGEQFELANPNKNSDRVAVQSWVTVDVARALFKAAGEDYELAKQAARSPTFKPLPLKAKVSFEISNRVRPVASRNVLALLPGSDPSKAKEPLFYSAHWDHLGRDLSLKGDQIYNGAVDNASGVGGLIEIARAYTQLPQAPARPIVFLAVTAEEQGLLGSRYYAKNPLYPLATSAGVINMDSLNVWGPTREVQMIGSGQNSMEDVLTAAAKDLGRETRPDAHPEKGGYYRSDQFEFAKVGVPGLYACRGSELLGEHAHEGEARGKEFTDLRYHKVGDEILPQWNLEGAALDLRLLFETGRRIADAPTLPQWRSTSEFKAAREAGSH